MYAKETYQVVLRNMTPNDRQSGLLGKRLQAPWPTRPTDLSGSSVRKVALFPRPLYILYAKLSTHAVSDVLRSNPSLASTG
jgi:hypothetical protein